MGGVTRAVAQDVPRIEAMVAAAYQPYVERLGRKPAPMTADYHQLVRDERMHVLRVDDRIVGEVALVPIGDALAVNNLVVDPTRQGHGCGRALMDHAEGVARSLGLGAIELYTNERMHEAIAFYGARGYTELDRRTEDGFARVFFRKVLADAREES